VGVRVLVVEDEKRLAAGLRNGLEAEGFAVDVALNGTDGLWLAREEPYDAIVLDIMLPEVSGYQICATLRDAGQWTPILMLTARTSEVDEVRALDSGADDYLAKPFSYAVLVARLRALLRRGVHERPAVLEAGDLRLDPASRRAWRGRAELELTAREMSVLEFLLRRRGEVVSKSDILAHVWDFDFEGDPNMAVSSNQRNISSGGTISRGR
jgi:two-component system, OmpR family, response regulator